MGKKLPIPIDKEEFLKLLEYAKKERESFRKKRSKKLSPRGRRIQQYIIAMVLGFGAGMRISEILGLKNTQTYTYKKKGKDLAITRTIYSNIPALTKDRIESNMIRIIGGKGGKDRQVPIPTKLFIKAGINRKLFLKNLPLTISRRSLQWYITLLGEKILNKKISFHTLRHGFVTHCLESGMDIHQVQMFAGHSRLDTTGIYLHANPKKALDKYEEVF